MEHKKTKTMNNWQAKLGVIIIICLIIAGMIIVEYLISQI